jgi:PleD family two-component response regulator
MEQFEEVFASDPFSDRQGQQNVTELEDEAFNRGLPAKGKSPGQPNENGLANSDQCEPAKSNHRPSFVMSPVILLIDDEEAFRSVIKQVLLKAGYDVVEAANGVEAINAGEGRH